MALWAVGALINIIGAQQLAALCRQSRSTMPTPVWTTAPPKLPPTASPAGSVLINLGTNIIKLGHTRFAVHADGNGSNGSGGGEKAPRLLRQPRRWWRHPGNKVWLGGMSMFSVGNLLK